MIIVVLQKSDFFTEGFLLIARESLYPASSLNVAFTRNDYGIPKKDPGLLLAPPYSHDLEKGV